MFTWISGFSSGVILLYFCAEFINTSLYSLKNSAFLPLFLLVPISALSFNTCRLSWRPLAFLFALSLGFSYALEASFSIKNAMLPDQYDKQNLRLAGFLCGLPKASEFSVSADFCITSLHSAQGLAIAGSGYKAKLRWPLDLKIPEQPVLVEVSARQSRATVNFAGFPYEKQLYYQGIVLNGTVLQVLDHPGTSGFTSLQWLRLQYHRVRSDIAQFSDALLGGLYHQGMIRALLLGDRSRLSVEDAKLLSNTGTQHLTAISGLHVGIVMLGLYALLPASTMSLLLVAILGGVYVFLVGFFPSAQRAWVMCLFGLLYLAGLVRLGRWHIYLLAVFVVLLLDPLAPLSLGFWFSFICVAVLLLMASGLPAAEHPMSTFVRLQCLLMLGLAIVSSALGLPHGPANILANLLAVPWISLLILPLVLSSFLVSLTGWIGWQGLFEFGKTLFAVLDGLLELLMGYLDSLSIFGQDWLFDPVLPVSLSYLLCFLCVLLCYRFKSIRLVMIPVMLLVLQSSSRMHEVKNELLVFDAGQGLAIAMSFDGQTWLFDTGPAYGRLSTVDQVILPYLRMQRLLAGTKGMIVSHGDADHAGDVSSLVDVLLDPVLISGEPDRLDSDRRFETCKAGMRWSSGRASLEVLYPFTLGNQYSDAGLSSNNHSCVVLYQLGGKRFLLMGDLEAEAELLLVKHYRHMLKADVLVAGHHGAAGSSSYALLKHVKPRYVVFSAGYANAFGHPSDKVLKRMDNLRSGEQILREEQTYQVLNTSEMGALRFEVEDVQNRLRIVSAREERSSLWIDEYVLK